jgi:hypothetical protein
MFPEYDYDELDEENADVLAYNMAHIDEMINDVIEAASITLQPGQSQIYNEDATLHWALTAHSPWDAADHIASLTDILHKPNEGTYDTENHTQENGCAFWEWWCGRLLQEDDTE